MNITIKKYNDKPAPIGIAHIPLGAAFIYTGNEKPVAFYVRTKDGAMAVGNYTSEWSAAEFGSPGYAEVTILNVEVFIKP